MDHSSNSLRTETKRVRGLGAAHEGTGHFWLQRVSALALIPLSVWMIIQLVTVMVGADRAVSAAWFQSPAHSLGAMLLVVALAVHARLGVQVIIEDYVHSEGKKLALLVLNNAANLLFGLASLFAIVRLHFIGI